MLNHTISIPILLLMYRKDHPWAFVICNSIVSKICLVTMQENILFYEVNKLAFFSSLAG